MKHDTKKNAKRNSYQETIFWRNVQPSNIVLLYNTVYKIDFELFGYSPWNYFTDINLPEKASQVKRLLEG